MIRNEALGTQVDLSSHNALLEIRNNFLSGIPIKCYLDKDIMKFILQNPDKLLVHTIEHPLNKSRPLKQSYQLSFLKFIINLLEKNGVEVNENMYSVYVNLLSSSFHQKDHYVHYLVLDEFISIRERTSVISSGTTGLVVWQAGIILAQYCTNFSYKFHDKNILELGSGLGFTGISTIISCKPKMYCFTDVHDDVLMYLTDNVTLNFNALDMKEEGHILTGVFKNSQVIVDKLDWKDTELSRFYQISKFDFILAADVIYDSTNFDSLCLILSKLIRNNETCQVIMACTIRNPDTLEKFFVTLHENGFLESLQTSFEAWNSNYEEKCQVQIFSIFLQDPK